jgi:hypothetical protein
VVAKLSRLRIESLRVWLWTLPAAKTVAVREEFDALCDMAAMAEEMCEQLETVEGVMATTDRTKLSAALAEARRLIDKFRNASGVLE